MPKKSQLSPAMQRLMAGILLIRNHPLFGSLPLDYCLVTHEILGKEGAAKVNAYNRITLNKQLLLSPPQWAYAIAHCQLHHSFGHFDAKSMPGFVDASGTWKPVFNKMLWNTACDLYIAKFLTDIKFGTPLWRYFLSSFPGSLSSEQSIYRYLEEHPNEAEHFFTGTASPHAMDMEGLDHPIVYRENQTNPAIKRFAWALSHSVSHTVQKAGGWDPDTQEKTKGTIAAEWFIGHYPLLGALAAAFKIIEDAELCRRQEIQIAAIDMELGEIYLNPSIPLTKEEQRFVLAHEYLHAGLQHQHRCQGRDPHLWNVACDYVINAWLVEMQIGSMPKQGLLYDESLKERSAEDIYDLLIKDLKKHRRLQSLRGYGKGEFLNRPKNDMPKNGVTLDEFCRNALAQGLEFTLSSGRGLIPTGLIEEIRSLAMPPIPWDVKLARWFDTYFPPLEKTRTYARPSRRQGSTPDIPRPRYIAPPVNDSRTFGVIIDTSGSMSPKELGKALGSIASYAAAREVPCARVIFCDAAPYDAGYLTPEDIAGRVQVKGRGGTRLQPAVDLLEHTLDFPKDGPILLITDGYIEPVLHIHRPHAYLLPQGCTLPFKANDVFYFA